MSIFKLRAENSGAYIGKRLEKEVNQGAVALAVQTFLDPAAHVFLQTFPTKKWQVLQCNDAAGIASLATSWNDGRSFFFGINPCGPLVDPLKDENVLRRRWLFIDIDRNKQLQPDDPATEQEHKDAMELANEVVAYLTEIKFPPPLIVDSGNGFHLYYRIDLPNDQPSKMLVRGVLDVLDNTFSDVRGEIDAACHDARRLSRMPGTWSRRGKDSKQRPYRQCQFVSIPSELKVVPVELLASLAGKELAVNGVPVPPIYADKPHNDIMKLKATVAANDEAGRKKAYARKALEDECRKAAECNHNRNDQLNKSSFALGQLVQAGLLDHGECKARLMEAAQACGLDKDVDGGGMRGAEATIESGLKGGAEKPRDLDAKFKEEKATKSPPASAKAPIPDATVDPSKPVIVRASDVTPRKIQWLWPGRIPLGKLTTFAGSGGLGKTFVLTDIAARVTRGDEWPDKATGNKPGKVLYISGEDDPEDTLVPRLIACNGIRENVAYLRPEFLGGFTLKNLELMSVALEQLGDDCLLVCIDPPTSFLGGADDHKNADLRQLLTPLSEWATQKRVAVVFITHVNKGAGKVDAVMRIIGSVAWSNAVRAAHMFAKDPDDPDRRLFVGVKVNGGKERKGLAYRIDQVDPADVDGPAKVTWLGEVDTTANEAINNEVKKTSRGKNAAEWLVERFREKLVWPSDELMHRAKIEGISNNAIYEAKKILDLPNARKVGLMYGGSEWHWWVPPDWPRLKTDENGEPITPAAPKDTAEF